MNNNTPIISSEEVIEYIENNLLNEVQISRIQDLKQIKDIREEFSGM